jgi:hypothetical protein
MNRASFSSCAIYAPLTHGFIEFGNAYKLPAQHAPQARVVEELVAAFNISVFAL